MNEWLIEEHRFLGRALIGNVWHPALIILQPDLELHIFLPGLYRLRVNEERPKSIEGQVAGWDIRIIDGPSSISFSPNSFDSFNEKMKLTEEEKIVFEDSDNKIWTEITFMPKTCTFTKIGLGTDIPDKWGLAFYPEGNNRILFHFFSDDRNPHLLRSNIFAIADRSVYFSNNEKWNLEAMQERLKLFTSCLSFFTGAPVSYELLVGKCEKEILVVQFKNESNPNAYVCPSLYNARIEVKASSLSTFSSDFIKKVEKLFPEREKILVLLSYFKMLYMANYDEAKIAFSFQLMEALAKYKGIRLPNSLKNGIKKDLLTRYSGKLCPSCYGLIEEELLPDTGDFDEYIEKALDAIMVDKSLDVYPSSIKEIARRYRNEIFHGNFFEDKTHIDKAEYSGTHPNFLSRKGNLFQGLDGLIRGKCKIIGMCPSLVLWDVSLFSSSSYREIIN